ncbi:MAG: glycosyltransferase [Planctomycetota bacterium]|jgi:glycosyltransferase involved in cell wall biosynthesis
MSTTFRAGTASDSRGKLPRAIPADLEIALLVSTYQKPWHLARVLASIAAQKGVDGRIEVVVTDDGSTDKTPQVVKRFARSVPFSVSFTTHTHAAFQLARCRNEGVAASKAPYLLFLDGDCVLPPDHVRVHLARRRANHAMGAYHCCLDEAATVRFNNDDVIRSAQYVDWASRNELRALAKRDLKSRLYQWIRHPTKPKLAGGNFGVWRRDYQRVNGYDENFEGWGCEDDDLRLRLRRSGVRTASLLRWTRTYHLWHPQGATTPLKWRDGPNVDYFHRPGRLTRCKNGLVKRTAADLAVRVVGAPCDPEAAAALLKPLWGDTPDAAHPEVELLFLPGRGRFSGRADCNVLIVLEDCRRAARLARKAHVLVAERPYPGVDEKCRFRPADFDQAVETLG